jgi:hypothetical protein
MVEAERTILWSAESVAPNNTSITLYDSIDNYDELIYYGSGTRTYSPCVMTEYPVISGVLNLGGTFFYGKWGTGDTWLLCNGTQVFLSGTSGFVASSYYWGKVDNGTAYNASLVNNRTNDVRPFKIVGVKYPNNYDRTLLWESNHTNTLYNTTISLNESVNHFKQIMVLGSGFENGGVGCRHASKNIYNTQNTIMGCDAWAYTPWKIAERHNLVIGQEMRISGNSGYIGSGYFMGMGNQTTAWAAGKWNADYQFSATAPYRIYGINRLPTYNVNLLQTEGGTISVSPNKGYEFDIATLTNTTANEDYKFSSYNITGATLTGDQFQFGTNDVQVQGNFEHNKTLTLIDGEHAVLSADKDKGFIGDVVTVTGTMDEGWYLTGFNTTGATMTGNKFAFAGEDVTVEGLYTDEGFPVTYEVQGGGTLTGETIAIPGQPLNIESAYNTYWRLSGFDITGGYIQDNQIYPSSAPFVVKAVYKPNAFTATGSWEKGSNVTVTNPASKKSKTGSYNGYAIRNASTGDIPASWYSTSNRWHPSNASAYKITLNPKGHILLKSGNNAGNCLTGKWATLIGSTYTNTAQGSINRANLSTNVDYNKTITSNSQTTYRLSAFLNTYANGQAAGILTAQYVAANTTGTWTATGYAP